MCCDPLPPLSDLDITVGHVENVTHQIRELLAQVIWVPCSGVIIFYNLEVDCDDICALMVNYFIALDKYSSV